MSKEGNGQLSDEFKKEIKESKRGNNFFGIVVAFIAIVLVFGTVGIAGYQMLFKSENGSTKSAAEKIESRPEEKQEITQSTQTTTTDAQATTTATTAPAATTANTPKDISYTVQSGDTWSSIANANGMTSTKLMEYNSTSSEDLQIGQTIKIPKG